MSCAGHPTLKTPNIDRLANEGVRFANMFCTTSLCSPSRASILTGLYAHTHGVRDNFTELPTNLTHWPMHCGKRDRNRERVAGQEDPLATALLLRILDRKPGDAKNRGSMKMTRRCFLSHTAGASALSLAVPAFAAQPATKAKPGGPGPTDSALEQAASKPVLQLNGLKEPVIIESIEVLRKGRDYFVRVRSKDGAEGVSVDDGRMPILHPLLTQLVIPYFIGKDARDLEEHLFQVYRYQSNYKYLGLALWCPVNSKPSSDSPILSNASASASRGCATVVSRTLYIDAIFKVRETRLPRPFVINPGGSAPSTSGIQIADVCQVTPWASVESAVNT